MPHTPFPASIGSDHRKTPGFSHGIEQAATNSELADVSIAIEVSIPGDFHFVTEYAVIGRHQTVAPT
jgi:hypothetical protein